MDENGKNTNRLTDLESSLMHLQSDFDSLNEIVLENSRRLDKLSAMIQRLTDRIDSADDDEPPRSLEDEKPPHY